MSFSRATTIWCDYTNKDNTEQCCSWYGDGIESITKLRKKAKKEGWAHKNKKDYCPIHKSIGEKE